MDRIEIVEHMRKKYRKRPHGRGEAYPAGGHDVHALCDVAVDLVAIVRQMQRLLDTDGQNAVEMALARILWWADYPGREGRDGKASQR